jgi:hypothetical protein
MMPSALSQAKLPQVMASANSGERLMSLVAISPTAAVQKMTWIGRKSLQHVIANADAEADQHMLIDNVFGWVKKPGGLARAIGRGKAKVDAVFTVIACNLNGPPKLMRETPTRSISWQVWLATRPQMFGHQPSKT